MNDGWYGWNPRWDAIAYWLMYALLTLAIVLGIWNSTALLIGLALVIVELLVWAIARWWILERHLPRCHHDWEPAPDLCGPYHRVDRCTHCGMIYDPPDR